jgi:hypothetical protein
LVVDIYDLPTPLQTYANGDRPAAMWSFPSSRKPQPSEFSA